MAERTTATNQTHRVDPGLALVAEQVEDAFSNADYHEIDRLLQTDGFGVWFGVRPTRLAEMLRVMEAEYESPSHLMHVLYSGMKGTLSQTGEIVSKEALAHVNFAEPRQAELVAFVRMGALRMIGRLTDAVEQGEGLRSRLGTMQPIFDSRDGWTLQCTVQLGVTAMLAGNFRSAEAFFTEARFHVLIPRFSFLTRDALAKTALIQVCFGDTESARALMEQSERVPRSSSWMEEHLDLYGELIYALTAAESPEASLQALETIDLHSVGEIWPFYIVVLHRVMEAAGYREELDEQLGAFDGMPLPRVDGQGFSGSVIPLKRAMLALDAGRGNEAQQLLNRADPQLAYTRLFQAAERLYAGRPGQALELAHRLRPETRGMRLMELRRLSVISAAQHLTGDIVACLETLKQALSQSRGLRRAEVQLFSPEVRRVGKKHLETWDQEAAGPSVFLRNLPNLGAGLTPREVEIVQQLGQGLTRAEIARELFISTNTVKSQLRSVFRKLGVSSAQSAVQEAGRRGLI